MEPDSQATDLAGSDEFFQKLSAEGQEEHRFVSGYMKLMHCSERSARAVYMHIGLTVISQTVLIS